MSYINNQTVPNSDLIHYDKKPEPTPEKITNDLSVVNPSLKQSLKQSLKDTIIGLPKIELDCLCKITETFIKYEDLSPNRIDNIILAKDLKIGLRTLANTIYRLKKKNLNVNEWLILKIVFLGYANTPSDIAAYLYMQRSSITRHLDKLVSHRLMVRNYQDDDRRTIKIFVTGEGEKI